MLLDDLLNPTVYLWGIKILEPVTSLTDINTGVICLVSAYFLYRMKRPDPVHRFMIAYFVAMGVGTLWGGFISHAFLYLVSYDWKAVGWSLGAIGIFCIEQSSLRNVRPFIPESWINVLQVFTVLQLCFFFGMISFEEYRHFDAIKFNSALGMAGIVLPIHFYLYYRTRQAGHGLIVLGILWSVFPAVIYSWEMAIDPWFNHHDLGHILVAISMIILYQGAKRLQAPQDRLATDKHKL